MAEVDVYKIIKIIGKIVDRFNQLDPAVFLPCRVSLVNSRPMCVFMALFHVLFCMHVCVAL